MNDDKKQHCLPVYQKYCQEDSAVHTNVVCLICLLLRTGILVLSKYVILFFNSSFFAGSCETFRSLNAVCSKWTGILNFMAFPE